MALSGHRDGHEVRMTRLHGDGCFLREESRVLPTDRENRNARGFAEQVPEIRHRLVQIEFLQRPHEVRIIAEDQAAVLLMPGSARHAVPLSRTEGRELCA